MAGEPDPNTIAPAPEHWLYGECDLDDVLNWVLPPIGGRACFVAVERGYIPQLGRGKAAGQAAENNIILLQQRIGRCLEKVASNVALAGPIWVPTAQQWRGKFTGWIGRTRGREQHKARAVAIAEQLVGAPLTTQPHWYKNGRRVGANAGRMLDNTADAICMAEAARRFHQTGQWPRWDDIRGY